MDVQRRIPISMNVDKAAVELLPTEAPLIYNMRYQRIGDKFVNKPLKGNLLVPCDFITNHECIGAFEDLNNNTVICCYADLVGTNHIVARYYPKVGAYGQLQMLIPSAEWNFSVNHRITCLSIADQYVMFSDDYNPPRYFDMEKANRTNKAVSGTIEFGKTDTGNTLFPLGAEYTFTATIPVIGTITSLILTADGTYTGSAIEGAIIYATAFNANTTVNPYFIATVCGCGNVTITELSASGDENGNITQMDTSVVSATPTTQIFIYNNIYPNTVTGFHIDRARWVFAQYPICTLGIDTDKIENFIQDINPQFAVRPIYEDNHYGSFSAISPIDFGSRTCGGAYKSPYNYIDVDFTDKFANVLAVEAGGYLQRADYLQEIKAVEIAVRENTEDLFQIAVRLERCDFGIPRSFFRYYNNLEKTALPENEQPTTKLFDAVPLLYVAETTTTGAGGDSTRTMLANEKSGFPPACPDIRIETQTTPNPACSALYTVIIDVKIYSPFADQEGYQNGVQAVWQYEGGETVFGGMNSAFVGYQEDMVERFKLTNVLPEKGFVGYLRGSDYMCISKQILSTAADFDYADTNFGSIYGEDLAGRNGVRSVIATGDVVIRFTFTGVTPGEYPFGIASSMCSYGDKMGKGEMYDLDKGRNYQNTSQARNGTDIIVVCPFYTASYEEQTLYIQRITEADAILDLTYGDSSAGTGSAVAIGYLKDANGINTPEFLKFGLAVEGMLFMAEHDISASYPRDTDEKFTDHNGFFYSAWRQLAWTSDKPSTKIDYYDSSQIKDFGENCYLGSLQAFYDGTLGDITQKMALGDTIRQKRASEYICYTKDSTPRNDAFNIVVSLEDQNGDPLAGIPVTVSNLGRSGLSDTLGKVELLKYSSGYMNFAIPNGQALVQMGNNCCIDPNTTDQAAELSFTEALPLTADILLPSTGAFPLTVFYEELFRTWKRGKQEIIAVEYMDRSKRSTTAEFTPNSIVYIPFWTQTSPSNRDYYALQWLLFSLPPQNSGFTHYQMLIGRTGTDRYVDVIADKVAYYQRYKDTANNTISTFAAGNATEIHISLEAINVFNQQNKNSTVQYSFVTGDRLRLIQQATGELFDTYIDVLITGEEGGSVVIKNSSDLPEITTGTLFEIYSAVLGTNNEGMIFNEIGDVLPLIESGGVIYHGGGQSYTLGTGINIVGQDQTATLPATGYLDYGNTYWHNRPYQTNVNGTKGQWQPPVESMYPSDFYGKANKSIGRPNIYTPDKKQTRFERTIRFSDPYYTGNRVNGLCSFQALNFKSYDINAYGIFALVANGSDLIALCQQGGFVVYLGKTEVVDTGDNGVLALSEKVLGTYNQFSDAIGTIHPQSVSDVNQNPIFFDANTGVIGLHTTGGNTRPSDDGFQSKFLQLAQTVTKNTFVTSAFDKQNREYVITIGSETFVYNVDGKYWRQFLFVPEAMCGTKHGFYAWKDGDLYIQDINPIINNFFGYQSYSQVVLVFNDIENKGNTKEHIFEVLRIIATFTDDTLGKWGVQVATCWQSALKRQQLTSIPQSDFQAQFSAYWAVMRRDLTTPAAKIPAWWYGDKMQGRILSVQLRNDNTQDWETVAFDLETNHSPVSY